MLDLWERRIRLSTDRSLNGRVYAFESSDFHDRSQAQSLREIQEKAFYKHCQDEIVTIVEATITISLRTGDTVL